MRSFLRYVASFLVMVGLLMGYGQYRDIEGQYQKYLESEQYVRQLREELEILRAEDARLEELVKNLESDPVEWEASIRRSKGWVRPEEKVYRIEAVP